MDLHGHGERAHFRVGAGKRHPGDVERVGEGLECLRPDHGKVACTLVLGDVHRESAVEHDAKKMAAETGNDCLGAFVAVTMLAMLKNTTGVESY